ncbi:Cys-tRNA(Pro) deacylase [Micrococcus sp. TA1]|uniref:Cys-tRNA(Pro) deacylase n=1 Tax=Micrococcus sp. TA1 TaxID=681627 RepID=UPI0016151E61|nr:Cys-tRNA(Pro)/Cys-tRNA(Cys) deacylase [Micrococcus sp. TA1]
MSGRPSRSAATPALRVLERAGVDHEVIGFESAVSPRSGYGAEAAAALGLEPAEVFKTLMVQLPDGSLAAAVVPVSGSLDLRAVALALGVKKVALADPALAERRTGYVVGGISPVGQRNPVPTVVDSSALDLPRMHVSAGQRGLEVRLVPRDLVAVTSAVVARIAAPR